MLDGDVDGYGYDYGYGGRIRIANVIFISIHNMSWNKKEQVAERQTASNDIQRHPVRPIVNGSQTLANERRRRQMVLDFRQTTTMMVRNNDELRR